MTFSSSCVSLQMVCEWTLKSGQVDTITLLYTTHVTLTKKTLKKHQDKTKSKMTIKWHTHREREREKKEWWECNLFCTLGKLILQSFCLFRLLFFSPTSSVTVCVSSCCCLLCTWQMFNKTFILHALKAIYHSSFGQSIHISFAHLYQLSRWVRVNKYSLCWFSSHQTFNFAHSLFHTLNCHLFVWLWIWFSRCVHMISERERVWNVDIKRRNMLFFILIMWCWVIRKEKKIDETNCTGSSLITDWVWAKNDRYGQG